MAKKEPWLPLPQLSREVDRLFDELIHRPWGFHRSETQAWNPELDLYETDTAFVLEVDLPGVQEKDVSVAVENDELVLQGSRSASLTATQGNLRYKERHAGQFVRRLRLPASVEQSQIRAEFSQGVLRVILPKSSTERTV